MNKFSKATLIALRIVVGWHFLYEGLWKIDSDTGSTMYATARYSIQSQTARLRDYFARDAVDLQPALAQVHAWHDNIVKAFAAQRALGEDQKARLAILRDNVKLAAADAARAADAGYDVVNFDWTYVHEEVLKVAAEQEGERFTAAGYLQNSAGPFRGLFRGLLSDPSGLDRLTTTTAQTRIDARYREILDHFRSAGKPFTADQETRLAAARDAIKQSIAAVLASPAFQTRLADYKLMQQRVTADASGLSAPFSSERLDADRKKLDLISAEMLAFVNEPLSELAVQTQSIATVDQLAAGPLPHPPGMAGWIDSAVKWALTAIGACLVLGLLTPVAALAAAGQLAMFYLASPPWPGLPAATMGGHYLYVDRNLIELVAALVIAATATGRWAGLDAYLYRWLERRHRTGSSPIEQPEPVIVASRS